ncbi:polymer-forming cytoskeletal protein [Haloarculaceae archaeon H-GB1-1]|nr:polymer-forming cytoskeletal protein [Haloarculaceae archaeon H-GB1-1]
MPIRSDPLDELSIPDGTTVEEHDLVTNGDVVIGGQSAVEFGVRGSNVMAGERVTFGGHIEAEGDCRLDMWCDVAGNVLVGEDAYLGERVHVDGELKVAGDLDIGDDVDIEEGFEANGWIVIRNPMPTIVFLFIYLSQLLRIGEEEAAEELVSTMLEGDTSAEPLVIPRGSRVSDDAWRVSTPATVGDDCRIHGNIRADSMVVGWDNTVFGSLRAKGDIAVGRGTEIKGDVTTRDGTVRIGPGAHVWGDISAEHVDLHENATVEGTIRVREEMTMHTDEVVDHDESEAEAMAEMAEELEDDGDVGVAETDGESDDTGDGVEAEARHEASGDTETTEAESDESSSGPAAEGDGDTPSTDEADDAEDEGNDSDDEAATEDEIDDDVPAE